MSDSSTRQVAIVQEQPLGTAAGGGCARLTAALERRGWACTIASRLPRPGECALVFVVVAGSAASPAGGERVAAGGARQLAARAGYRLPAAPDALGFCALPKSAEHPPLVLVAGGDERGLTYALLEAARRIELLAPGAGRDASALTAAFPASVETPERAVRSVCIFPHHAALDREWYRSPAFWRWYFDLLALHRFNAFSLTFGFHTAYMSPPYPFFVPMPDFPDVTVPGLTEAQREDNLALLRTISHLAVERGLDFTLGVWSQHAYRYGRSEVDGLRPELLQDYCAAGTRRMLEACPDISTLQLRVNSESGVQLDEGAAFWRALFAGVRDCGRPIRLDLRAKAIVDDTISAALETGLPVTVSTKFWMEHQGLPYHATELQDGDRFVRRHSYGDLLRGPRDYDFVFRLWTVGTNKLLLWGDPDWIREFARSSTLGGARGFEVCAPLSNKGFGGLGGRWRIFADPAHEHYEWEQERYWYWYALFGRLGYSDSADPASWRREWAARLGPAAAPAVEDALQAASGFLPLITACHAPTASAFSYWPEKDMGGLLDLYLQVEPSDVAMFASPQRAVDDALRGTPTARLGPCQLATRFDAMADQAVEALERAAGRVAPVDERATREWWNVERDVRIQAQLARYHAAKFRAAEGLAWFYAAGDLDSLQEARPAAARALEAWEALVALTEGVYQDNLLFGRVEEQSGHWRDSLPYARHDVARLEQVEALFTRYGLFDAGFDFGAALPVRGGAPLMAYLHDYSVERRFTGVSPHSLYSPEAGWGWGSTYRLAATELPAAGAATLRAATANPPDLPHHALYGDFISRQPAASYDNATFLVDRPNGEYEVTIILADCSAAPVDHGPMTVTVQGRQRLGPVNVPAGEVVELRARAFVATGRLELDFNAPPGADWLVTGLIVTRVGPHIGHRPAPTVRPGEPYAVRATVTDPEPVATVTVHYRFGASEPYRTAGLALAAPGNSRWHGTLAVPKDAGMVEYFLAATDSRGTVQTWPPEGAAAPRRVHAGLAAEPPVIAHQPAAAAVVGQPLTVSARVTAGAPLARVTLHYRDVNQLQAHIPLAMERTVHGGEDSDASGTFFATIPGAHVSAGWDLMYHLEAVDVLGNASFFPGLAAGTPYVVVGVSPAGTQAG